MEAELTCRTSCSYIILILIDGIIISCPAPPP